MELYNTFNVRKIKNKISLINAFKHNLRFGNIAENVKTELTYKNEYYFGKYNGDLNYEDFSNFVKNIYYEKVEKFLTKKIRKNAVLATELIFSAPKEYLEKGINYAKWKDAIMYFIKNNFPTFPILNAAIHNDETTPHFHVLLAPIEKTENTFKLNSRKFFSPKILQQLHTNLEKETRAVGLDLSRGKRKIRAKAQDIKDFYANLNIAKENYENEIKNFEYISFEDFILQAKKHKLEDLEKNNKLKEIYLNRYFDELKCRNFEKDEMLKKFFFENNQLKNKIEKLEKLEINKNKNSLDYIKILNNLLNLNLNYKVKNKLKINENENCVITQYQIINENTNKNINLLDFLKIYFDYENDDDLYNSLKKDVNEKDFKELKIEKEFEKIKNKISNTEIKKSKNIKPRYYENNIEKCIDNILLKNKYLKKNFLKELFDKKYLHTDRNNNIVVECNNFKSDEKSYFIFGTLLKANYFKEITNNENNISYFPLPTRDNYKKYKKTIFTTDIYQGLFLLQNYNAEVLIVNEKNFDIFKKKFENDEDYIFIKNLDYEKYKSVTPTPN